MLARRLNCGPFVLHFSGRAFFFLNAAITAICMQIGGTSCTFNSSCKAAGTKGARFIADGVMNLAESRQLLIKETSVADRMLHLKAHIQLKVVSCHKLLPIR